jgi:hypothetical protein
MAMMVLLIVVNIFLLVAEAQSINRFERVASNEKRPISGMISSFLLGGIMNMFSENDSVMIKEDEQGGGRNVRCTGQTLLEEQAVPPEDSLESTVYPHASCLYGN